MSMARPLLRPVPLLEMRRLSYASRLCLRVQPLVVSGGGRWKSVGSTPSPGAQGEASSAAIDEGLSAGGGCDFSGTVAVGTSKLRLDTWLAEQLPRVSRARVQGSIKHGLAVVNGQPATKVSRTVKGGDRVQCRLLLAPSLKADPEDIPLDIVFEDEHLLVVNKPAHMVVHPAPGHSGGTLVNALLHHCGLPAMQYSSGSASRAALGLLGAEELDEDDSLMDGDDLVEGGGVVEALNGVLPVIRPGIVHRLDKGTSGLLVIAKDDHSHVQLCEQFKAREVSRTYVSICCGVPRISAGRIEVPIGRDVRDRKRMAAILRPGGSTVARFAASRYRVVEVLVDGGSALIEWKLETGRTHQIRVHAQHLGNPILGDETYGGTSGAALSRLIPHLPSAQHGKARQLLSRLERPCLHAMTIGFRHPWTGMDHNFTRSPPRDFEDTWLTLQEMGIQAM